MLASMPNQCDQSYEFCPKIIYQFPTTANITDIKLSKNHIQNQKFPDLRWQTQPPHPQSLSTIYTFNQDQQSFNCLHSQKSFFSPISVVQPMQSSHTSHFYPCRLEKGQDIPRSVTNLHRESLLSSLASADPELSYTANLSSPKVVEDIFDLNDIHSFSTKKNFTSVQIPSHEALLVPQFSSNFQSSSSLSLDFLSMPEMGYQDRPSLASSLSNGSPSTPPQIEQERKNQQQDRDSHSSSLWVTEDISSCDHDYRNMTKLDRVMTNVYEDNMYNSGIQISTAPSPSISSVIAINPSPNEIFEQELHTTSSQHMYTNSQVSLIMSTRECTPFRHDSPLAPITTFGVNSPNLRIETAHHLHEQKKVENEKKVLKEQFPRESMTYSTSNTISPKDVDIAYQEGEEDSMVSLFKARKKQPKILPSDSDESLSRQNYGRIVKVRRDSSSPYQSSEATPSISNNFSFSMPVEQNVKCTLQQYSFLPTPTNLQNSGISKPETSFQASPPSTELTKSDFERNSEDLQIKKPIGMSANTGTYTCTYNGCTLRFDTPARLQRHKRESHRSSSVAVAAAAGSTLGGFGNNGMTSAAYRNSQAGPHRCDRINPSTGKPCNTVFSRPYDLTRHEDTIHNTQKQKVYCPLCEDEKSFSRNDALTRHMRVVHPEYVDTSSRRRRGPSR